jgi:magnesium chelatase subunit I
MSRPQTLGELKRSGYRPRTVKEEMRENALRMIAAGDEFLPGIIGFDRTVLPQLKNAILSKHDFILLGLRGQAKTRILRSLIRFLDEAIPVLANAPLNDDPLKPLSAEARRIVAEQGDSAPIEWLAREDRYREKLATPDVTLADLIGDVDPIKAASRRLSLADPEAIHFGIIPRSNRCIFALNELPDLQPRIQVGLLNIMQEKDVQIRGFPVRFPLDLVIVYSANPEDYTNRGNIITPLKDRIDSQIITHYPTTLDDALKITTQEAWSSRDSGFVLHVPQFIREAIEEVTFQARESEYVDQGSGVSARLSITALENLLSNMERRAAQHGQTGTCARVADLYAALPALTGKIELVYEGEQEGLSKVARLLTGKAVARVFKRHFPGAYKPRRRDRASGTSKTGGAQAGGAQSGGRGPSPAGGAAGPPIDDSSPYHEVIQWFSGGKKLDLSDEMSEREYREALEKVTGLKAVAAKHWRTGDEGETYAAMELVLEGLHQNSLLSKEDLDHGFTYGDMLQTMFSGMSREGE